MGLTSLSPAARLRAAVRVSSDQGNSREQSTVSDVRLRGRYRAVEGAARCQGLGVEASRGVKRAFVDGVAHRGDAGDKSASAPQGAGDPPDPASGRTIPLLRSCSGAAFRPGASRERGVPRTSPRRRAAPESSCGTPMHAASLTKGYGGNPPSGRSVSPPRTGPFFCAPGPARNTGRNSAFRTRGRPTAASGVGFASGDCHTGRDRPRPRPGRMSRPVRSVRRG